jgi:hypothetical protein
MIKFRFPRLILALLLAVIFSAPGLRAEPSAFVSVIPDLPLMAGLIEDTAAGVVFETTSGRIAEAHASGSGDHRLVITFYAATLPQLGWHLDSRTRYRREGEVLSLDVQPEEGATGRFFVNFRLTPATR